ncbi:MAG: multicopper oxidase domain-containing protein [Parafilimonas sp.]
MKYFFSVIACFFALQNFAQDGHSHDMNMDMKMNDKSYLPNVITHAVIKSWGASNLFKTELDTSSLVYLTGKQEHTVTIKAFQQKFYDDPSVLKPVWVLGYVSDESNQPPALPGPVIVAEYAQPTKIFWVNKVYETLQTQANYQLYPTYDAKTKAHPFVPIVYNVNDPTHVPMVADALYPDFRLFPNGVDPMHEKLMDMSTYYSTTVHLHGANLTWQNDGYPTSKYYPKPGSAAVNITWGLFGKFEQNKIGQHYFYPNVLPEGERSLIKSKMQNVSYLPNDNMKYEGHHGAILWYHDHAMMRTATDIYTGQAGVYIIKGEDEKVFSSLVKYKHDVPLLFADKSFTESNYLYYNTTQSFFNGNTPEAEGQPEFFGNTITVNGKIWPYMNVSKSLYRFRIVNASTSRFYRIALAKWKDGKIDTTDNAKLSANFIQVGTEGGFFPDGNFPRIGNDSSALTIAPAERVDVLINFSSFEPGTSLVLLNYAPDGPFGDDDLQFINDDGTFSDLTNYVMLFHVNQNSLASSAVSESTLTNQLNNFSSSPIYKQTTSSQYLYSKYNNSNQFKTNLQKALSAELNGANNKAQLVNKSPLSSIFPKESDLFNNANVFKVNITEAANYQDLPEPYKKYIERNPMLQNDLAFPMAFLNETEWNQEAHTGDTSAKDQYEKVVNNYSTEIWAIWNGSDDAHPIHIHLNRFRILGRQKADDAGNPLPGIENFSLPEPNEMGWKDVVRAKPGYINYIIIQYILYDPSQEGQFVYHCHIAEHEDMSMMRRLVIKPDNSGAKFVLASY